MATELIRIDVIEHKAESTKRGSIKRGTNDRKTKTKTPEEQQKIDDEKEAREKAKAGKARARAIRSGIVYTSMAVRKIAQVGGQIATTIINASFTRQEFSAQMLGDTRRSQLLQNKKTKISSANDFTVNLVNQGASVVAGFAINKVLGIVQAITYISQLSINLVNLSIEYNEKLREFNVKAERELAQSEYYRKRLLVNTFNNRGLY
jgi:hypothetical protein